MLVRGKGLFVLVGFCALASIELAGAPVRSALFDPSLVELAVQGSLSGAGTNTLTRREADEGWILLFDGRTLGGWTTVGGADWTVEDGTVTFHKGQGMLVTERSFADYELRLEFWGEKTANSGVFLRCPAVGAGNPGATSCYEVNIFDAHETAPTGSIVNVHSVLPDRPDTAEKWNAYEMTLRGSHLMIKLNGRTTVDVQENKLKLFNGTIALQAGGPSGPGRIKFRNIKIRPLK